MSFSTILTFVLLTLNQQSEDLFKKGVYLFEHQDFKQSIIIFNKIVNNNLSKDENELAECYKYLGAAHFYLEDLKGAEANFRQLLLLKPDTKLDPFLFPPSMVLFFDKLKQDLPITRKTDIERAVNREKYLLYVNLLPFGLPQFSHNQNTKGSIILSLQIISISANIYSYWQVQSMIDRYGFVKDYKTADRVNTFKTIQITSLISFGSIYLYSILDGMYYSSKGLKGGD